MLQERISDKIREALDKLRAQEHKARTCSFCPNDAVSSHLVREGVLPNPYREINSKNPDNSHLRVVRVCAAHKDQVPR